MSKPSNWPLTRGAIRYIIPSSRIHTMEQHPLSASLHPLSVGFYPSARGHYMKRDFHDDWLMLYCFDGGAYLQVNGETTTVRRGDMVFLPRDVTHAYWADQDNPWTVFWVHFAGAKVEDYIKTLLNQPFPYLLPVGYNTEMVQSFRALLSITNNDNDQNVFLYGANVLKQLLAYTCYTLSKPSMDKNRSGIKIELVYKYFEQHINEMLNLDNLAGQFNMSKYSFAKTYKALTGQSPINAFIHLKMKKAKQLLQASTLSVKEISAELGYEDPYYFSRAFKKFMGMSPKHFRELDKG